MNNGVNDTNVATENKSVAATPNDVQSLDLSKKTTDGQTKCPSCGATDIILNPNTGKLRCNYCRHEFEDETIKDESIFSLEGVIIGTGASTIETDVESIITIKCESCGAEVVIDSNEETQSRCHWCRNILSINKKIPNGAIPDMVLPFSIKKEDAESSIKSFVKKRQFYANTIFKAEFTTENILGVYLPYMVVDVNAHATLSGEGEVLIREYTVGSKENKKTRYDADSYFIKREFDIAINNVTVESSLDKLNHGDNSKTNNIINAIMPFDIENCVRWDANYLRGFTSEKRNVDIEHVQDLLVAQSKDIAQFKMNETLKKYNRGVRWDDEVLNIKGQKWLAAYLPVWIYSYQQVNGNKKILHYVAVNARTKEIMGSVPVNTPKLLFVSFLVELVGFFAMLFVDSDISFLFLLAGFIYYFIIYNRYRNHTARHFHETETHSVTKNLLEEDKFLKRKKGLSNSKILGVNNNSVEGSSITNNIFK